MALSDELTWRGFVNQTTFKDNAELDGTPLTFYWGVDPSAASMTVGNLAAAMMVRHFIDAGHKAILLVGGATGMIGDPDGKKQERDLLSIEALEANKAGIAEQYRRIFAGKEFQMVDNYDWFKGIGYLDFLRDVGKHVPMRQMLGRDFVQSRLGEEGAGISYAEFSYSLIQGYDYLHLYREHGVTLQVCGADQWGNSITGVDLIRRVAGGEAHVWSAPLVINKTTGVKFGKSEAGAVWLDPNLTSPTEFYQFWVNCDDAGVEDYLKIYTLLKQDQIADVMARHNERPGRRTAQITLAEEVTRLVHGEEALAIARDVTNALTGRQSVETLTPEALDTIRHEIPTAQAHSGEDLSDVLVAVELATSKSDARRLLANNAISVNGKKTTSETVTDEMWSEGRFIVRRGKAFKDSALIERA